MNKVTEYTKEFIKCRNDPVYFIDNYIKVSDVGQESIPLRLYPKQKELVYAIHNKHRIVLLGARQTGKTTILEAYIVYLLTFFDGYKIAHFSKALSNAITNLREIKFMLTHLPKWMRYKFLIDNSTLLKLSNNSMIQVNATADNTAKDSSSDKGRGFRASFLWIDEAAYMKLDRLKTSVFPMSARALLNAKSKGLPYGIVIGSTYNGVSGRGKEFYEMYKYARDAETDEYVDGEFYRIKIEWRDIPVYTKEWYESKKKELGYYKSEAGKRNFMQEYDLVPLGSLDSLFPDDIIEQLKIQPIVNTTYVKHSSKNYRIGPINWYKEIDPEKLYLVGIDIATRLGGSDKSAIEIVEYSTLEQVGEFNKKCLVDDIKEILLYLGTELIPRCIFIPENNGIGNEIVEFLLINYHLSNKIMRQKTEKGRVIYGINTNVSTRRLILDSVYEALAEDASRVKSENIITEIPGITLKGKRYEGTHDDTVFAYGFTTYASIYLRSDLNTIIYSLPKGNPKQVVKKMNMQIEDIIRSNDTEYKKYIASNDIENASIRETMFEHPHVQFKITKMR